MSLEQVVRHLPSVTRGLDTCWTPCNKRLSEGLGTCWPFGPLWEASKRNEDQQYAMRTTSLHSRKRN